MFSPVAIIPYNTGNIKSVYLALEYLGANPFVPFSLSDIDKAKGIILPGVGHFGTAISFLNESGYGKKIKKLICSGMPVLGICLGFQLLTNSSEESANDNGLNAFPLKTIRIKTHNPKKYKVPHMGWNTIDDIRGNSLLLKNLGKKELLFYYSNAYGIKFRDNFQNSFSTFSHDSTWIASFELNNIFGVQFHPEKSRFQGLEVLKNFINLI